jgi:RHS repeat-associated protein
MSNRMLRPPSKIVIFLSAALICLLFPAFARGQGYLYATGTPTFTTQWPDQLGFINVSNGNIHIEIPLAQHAQRGSLHLNERLVYDSRIWTIAPASTNYQWQPTNVPNSMGGWRLVTGNEGGTLSYLTYIQSGTCGPRNAPCVETYVFLWTDPGGTQHSFIGPTVDRTSTPCSTGCSTAFTSAIDASGYQLKYINKNSSASVQAVYDPNGTRIYPSVQDPNGNAWTKDASGNLVDTLGRTPLKTTVNGNQIYYDVLTYGGATSRYTVTTETVNVKSAFGEDGVSEYTGSLTAIQSIELPDGTYFQFSYDSGTSSGNYGELTGVTLPTGGTITYGYGNYFDSYQNVNRWPASRTDSSGTTKFDPQVVTQCSSGGTGCVETMTVTKPDHNDVVYTLTLNNGSWNTQIDEYSGSSTSGGTKLRTTLPTYDYTHACSIRNACTGAEYISKTAETVTLWDAPGGPVAKQTQFATNLAVGKLSSVKEWDYYPVSSGPPSSPARQTAYAYNYYVNGAGLLTQTTVADGAGNQVSQTTNGYDETTGTGHDPLTTTSGLANHNAATGNRGNLTTTSQWINTTGGSLSTAAAYDDAGALLTSTDPTGATTYGYDPTDTFTTSVTPPIPSSGVALTSSSTYDFSTGLISNATDPNKTQTAYKSYDSYGRAREVDILDSGGNTVGKSTVMYQSPNLVYTYKYQDATTAANNAYAYDGYGRMQRTAVNNGQSGNGFYQQDTCLDSMGRIHFKAYTYQGTGLNAATVCSGAGDTYGYDALGRTTSVTHGDSSASYPDIQKYAYTGRAVESTDENGVSRITQTDALGRVTYVCEVTSTPLSNGDTPAPCGLDISATGFLTTYAYTTDSSLNQVTTVTQGAQTRVTKTDSLGRTVYVSEPERGVTTYSYSYSATPGLGLTVARTRPMANPGNAGKTTTTTTQYDSLGRVVSVTYNDNLTPYKAYYYDNNPFATWAAESPANVKGRLSTIMTYTIAANGAGTFLTSSLYSYDAVGDVAQTWSCTPSTCGTPVQAGVTLRYAYDWAGNQTAEIDQIVGEVQYTYSPAGEVTSIINESQTLTGQNPGTATLVSNVVNGPNGPISFSLGNGLSQYDAYDALGRTYANWVCSGAAAFNCSPQLYGFALTAQKGTQVTGIDDYDHGVGFQYDQLNRLKSSTFTNAGTFAGDSFLYSYDRYGNRTAQTATAGSGPQPQFTVNPANNQITTSGYQYDGAGNMTNDGLHQYTYDAEGNILTVAAEGGGIAATYTYDAQNRRVRSAVSGTTTDHLYDYAGRKVSDWIDPAAGNFGLEYEGRVYWGNRQIAFRASQDGTFYFDHQDWEGTERLRTNYLGQAAQRYSSLPWGDGSTPAVDGTNAAQDNAFFAGTDFDPESGTDHAQFRNYSQTQGRWLAPDPYDGSYDPTNPQSFNRYIYAQNNPIVFTDPSGKDPFTLTVLALCGDSSGACAGGFSNPVTAAILGGIFAGAAIADLFEAVFAPPAFHGTLQPRPSAANPASTAPAPQVYSYPPGEAPINAGSPFVFYAYGIGGSIPDISPWVPSLSELVEGTAIVGATVGTAVLATATSLLMVGDNHGCIPPAGTQCYEEHSGHTHNGWDPHSHIWTQNQNPTTGVCFWNATNGPKGATQFPPAGMNSCSSYPTWPAN